MQGRNANLSRWVDDPVTVLAAASRRSVELPVHEVSGAAGQVLVAVVTAVRQALAATTDVAAVLVRNSWV